MRISTFFYTIRQGFRNAFRNKSFTLASIATIAACLFLFGVFYSIISNFQYMIKSAEKGVSVTVFFDEGVTDDQIMDIGNTVCKRPEVEKVVFVSDDVAWSSFKKEYLGQYQDGFTENPLEGDSSLQIYMRDVSMQGSLVDYLQSMEGVRQVNQSEMTATTLTGVNALVAYISVGIIVILLAVSIFLISNTVNVGISVRAEEINIMKYIGATDFFVRSPFVIEGMLIGLIGASIPLVAIYYLYNLIIKYMTDRFATLSKLLTFMSVNQVFDILVPVSLITGVGIGFLGSFVTVRKHLRV
jgi:cell division transport system permease protein